MRPDDEIPEALIDDDTRVVDRHRADTGPDHADNNDDTRVVDRESDRTRVVDRESDRTRVVDRTADDDTRIVRAPVQPSQPHTLSDMSTGPAFGGAAPRSDLLTGASRPPETPIGSIARYGVRAQQPALSSRAREDFSAGDPVTPLAATAEEIRRSGARRAKRRSLAALGVVIGVSLVVAAAATVVMLLILGI